MPFLSITFAFIDLGSGLKRPPDGHLRGKKIALDWSMWLSRPTKGAADGSKWGADAILVAIPQPVAARSHASVPAKAFLTSGGAEEADFHG